MATPGIVAAAEVRRVLRRSPDGGTLFLRATAEWCGPDVPHIDGTTDRGAPCSSPLGGKVRQG